MSRLIQEEQSMTGSVSFFLYLFSFFMVFEKASWPKKKTNNKTAYIILAAVTYFLGSWLWNTI
jgi:preprotein translocase subunit SecE